MCGQKRLCPVKSLTDRTSCPLFYASNVIQTFTFLNIRLVKIGYCWWSWRKKSWGRERKRRPDQERLLRKPFITRVGRGKEIGIVLISRTFVLKQDGNFANFGGGGKLWVLACATITTTETPTTCKCWLLKPLIFCSKLRLALRSHIRSHRYIYFFRDHHLLF